MTYEPVPDVPGNSEREREAIYVLLEPRNLFIANQEEAKPSDMQYLFASPRYSNFTLKEGEHYTRTVHNIDLSPLVLTVEETRIKLFHKRSETNTDTLIESPRTSEVLNENTIHYNIRINYSNWSLAIICSCYVCLQNTMRVTTLHCHRDAFTKKSY